MVRFNTLRVSAVAFSDVVESKMWGGVEWSGACEEARFGVLGGWGFCDAK